MSIGLHKEPSLKARLELFATNITVLEMRWQHVPNLGCRDAETARTITRGPSTWYNHVIVVSTQQSEAENEREQRRSLNRCRVSTLVIGHGYSPTNPCCHGNKIFAQKFGICKTAEGDHWLGFAALSKF